MPFSRRSATMVFGGSSSSAASVYECRACSGLAWSKELPPVLELPPMPGLSTAGVDSAFLAVDGCLADSGLTSGRRLA